MSPALHHSLQMGLTPREHCRPPLLPQTAPTRHTPQQRRLRASASAGPLTPGDQLVRRNRGELRLFLDTADLQQWEKWLPCGAFFGVTTNPTLLERAGVACTLGSLRDLSLAAFSLGAEEVQLQTWGGHVGAYVANGRELAYIDPRVVVKVPITREGLEAARTLVRHGVRVTMTGLYAAYQVLLAAGVGAEYAAPYLGRISALGKDGEDEVIQMQEIKEGLESDIRILVASIKSPQQVAALAVEGVGTFTLPPPVVDEMFGQKDTLEAAAAFERAAEKMQEGGVKEAAEARQVAAHSASMQ